MPVDHYENFPVASWLVPARLRPAVEAIYIWARTADDLADEGDASPAQRLAALQALQDDLQRLAQGQHAEQRVTQQLAPWIGQHRLPISLFADLLSAFSQDVSTPRYEDFEQVRDYCRRSANPIGRLMLHLYNAVTPTDCQLSDAICTGLQLTNFWQDIALDWQKNRVYLPQAEMRRFGVSDAQIAAAHITPAWRHLLRYQIQRTRALLESGAPLAHRLPGRIGWELRLVVQGGQRILERIEQVDFDIFRARPTLEKTDWATMAWRAWQMKPSSSS